MGNIDKGISPNIPKEKMNPAKDFSMFSKCSFATTSSMFFK
jgi:hypothetical protein